MGKPINLQDAFLNTARREKLPVTIHVTNGYQLNDVLIAGYDSYVILAQVEGKQLLIYKHAVSTITFKGEIIQAKDADKEQNKSDAERE
ncbi:MAG: RNA chaperone Hfq [Christensenellaceae bacterium]|jgi:host factor-I protein|nr:RNA chaperone Hfq [Christensenellaceae bacterium]